MSKRPKIFVGTLYSGEGEIAQCCDMINKQQHVDVTHVIISHLPEKDAHNALWAEWRKRKASFDLFVKVDADTILIDTCILARISDKMLIDPRITGLQAPLFDYMTNDMINGLNCFTPKVQFNDTTSELFCDRQVDVNHDIVLKGSTLPDILRPAGYHCLKPTDIQAFHYGLHRALKGQYDIISKVKNAAYDKASPHHASRLMALLGADAAATMKDKSKGFNYTDPELILAFQNACKLLTTIGQT